MLITEPEQFPQRWSVETAPDMYLPYTLVAKEGDDRVDNLSEDWHSAAWEATQDTEPTEAKDVTILGQNNGVSSRTGIDTFVPITVTTVQGMTDVRHVSASTLELNASITIPLGVAFNRWRP